jgi:hypothetical protein
MVDGEQISEWASWVKVFFEYGVSIAYLILRGALVSLAMTTIRICFAPDWTG